MEGSRGSPPFPASWGELLSTSLLSPAGQALNPNSGQYPGAVWGDVGSSPGPTSLAVGLSLLHVEGTVADGSFAGCTGEALHVPGHLQCMHDLLEENCCQPGGSTPHHREPPLRTERNRRSLGQDKKGQSWERTGKQGAGMGGAGQTEGHSPQ